MLKKVKLLFLSILFLAIFAITLIVIDNIPRDYRNLDKIEEYKSKRDLAISQHPDIYKRLCSANSDCIEWTYEDFLEEQDLLDNLYVVCTSVDELREYVVMSNRVARKTAREMARKAMKSPHPGGGNLLFCDFK